MKSAHEIADSIKSAAVFHNVTVVDQDRLIDIIGEKSKIQKRLLQVPVYLNAKRTFKKMMGGKLYRTVYIGGNSVLCRLTALYNLYHDKQCKIIYFDDGIGTYCNDEITKLSIVEKAFQFLFFRRIISRKRCSFCLFCPDLYRELNPNSTSHIEKNTQLARTPENDKIVKSIFNCSEEVRFSQKIIILDTIKELDLDDVGVKQLNKIYSDLLRLFPKDIIFKQHPKDIEFDEIRPHFQNKSIPFEYYCYFNDMSEKIIISNLSSAALTPNLLFAQKPSLIFLYQYFGKHNKYDVDFDSICEYLKRQYDDPAKIALPNEGDNIVELVKKAFAQ